MRTTGLVASKTSVIAERANLFAEVIVYAQRFVASNNATHSCDKSHNRWLCPLRSISANASACFSLRLRSARVPGFTRRRRAAIFQNRNKSPHRNKKKNSLRCSFFWWRCGDLNPGSSFYTRHLLHAYSVIKFSYRRSPTDGGFEEAENADLLTAVGKSVARSV